MKYLSIAFASLLFALVGCKTTYELEPSGKKDAAYAFARPERYVIFGTKSARDWLEIVDAQQEVSESGVLKLRLALRNRGNQGLFSWAKSSHDMTIYATADFFDKDEKPLQRVARRALTLPLGETVYVEWLATSPNATSCRVLFAD